MYILENKRYINYKHQNVNDGEITKQILSEEKRLLISLTSKNKYNFTVYVSI